MIMNIERDSEDNVRAVLDLADGEFKGKWRREAGQSDAELLLRALIEYGERLAMNDKGHRNHAEAVAAGSIIETKKRDARQKIAAFLRPGNRNEIVATYEQAGGHTRWYRVEPHYSGINGVYWQPVYDVPELNIWRQECGAKHDTYDDACVEIGTHLERLPERDCLRITDLKVQESHDRIRQQKTEQVRLESNRKVQEELAYRAKQQANAEAKIELDRMTAKIKGKKGMVPIKVGDGTEQTQAQGIVIGPFLVHKRDGVNGYIITHIASGMKASDATTLAGARQLAALTGRHGDWSVAAPDKETMSYGLNVCRQWVRGDWAGLLKHVQEHDCKANKPKGLVF
jgi:hypothetical protein